MSIMGWSSTSMAARYQHVTDPIRREVANCVGGLLLGDQARADALSPRGKAAVAGYEWRGRREATSSTTVAGRTRVLLFAQSGCVLPPTKTCSCCAVVQSAPSTSARSANTWAAIA
jgi:hypothetical protein